MLRETKFCHIFDIFSPFSEQSVTVLFIIFDSCADVLATQNNKKHLHTKLKCCRFLLLFRETLRVEINV